jgi:hypothetical protein
MTVLEVDRADRTGAWTPGALERRALALWPRLDPAALRRCRHDARRIAVLVSRRTTMPPETILRALMMPTVQDDEIGIWFG